MKKLFVVILVMLLLAGCNQTGSQQSGKSGATGGGTVSVTVDNSGNNKPLFNSEEVLAKLETVAYTGKSKYGSYYLALVVKNNSTMDCTLRADVSLKDQDGNLIGAKEDEITAFGAGEETCFLFSNEDGFASYEYEYTVDELDYYEAVCKDLICEAVPVKDKVIVTVTNNGTKTAECVTSEVLFMQGDQIIGTSWSYIGDGDSEIKPGRKETEEVGYWGTQKYDNVKVYLQGRSEIE